MFIVPVIQGGTGDGFRAIVVTVNESYRDICEYSGEPVSRDHTYTGIPLGRGKKVK